MTTEIVPVIDVRPQRVDLALYAGDGASIRLICRQGEDLEPLPMSGTVDAHIRVDRDDPDPPVADFLTDMSQADPDGIVFISLTDDQTRALVEHESAINKKFSGVWDVEWTPTGADPRTIAQGKVTCENDVTRTS
jgi:hypothetical protein